MPLSPLKSRRKQGVFTNQRQLRTAEPAVLSRSRDRHATDYNDGTALGRSRGRFYRPNDEEGCDQARPTPVSECSHNREPRCKPDNA